MLSGIIVTFHMKSDTILLSKSLGKADLIYDLQIRNIMQYWMLVYY